MQSLVQMFSSQPASNDPWVGMTAQRWLEQEAVVCCLGHLLCLQICGPDRNYRVRAGK